MYALPRQDQSSAIKNGISIPAGSFVIVLEPLDQDMKHWEEMPSGTFATIHNGKITIETLEIS